jgi:hypothetical protein
MRSLRRTKNGILVTSSGIDAILEVNLDGEIIWDWFGTEQGYSTRYGGGERTIDRDFDHRTLCYSGKLQTTHLNSAIVDPYDESKILTILFYQGKVARIDRETLQLEHVINNLNGAHHIRPHSKGYMLSNSRKGGLGIWVLNLRSLPSAVRSRKLNVLQSAIRCEPEGCSTVSCTHLTGNKELVPSIMSSNWKLRS